MKIKLDVLTYLKIRKLANMVGKTVEEIMLFFIEQKGSAYPKNFNQKGSSYL